MHSYQAPDPEYHSIILFRNFCLRQNIYRKPLFSIFSFDVQAGGGGGDESDIMDIHETQNLAKFVFPFAKLHEPFAAIILQQFVI